ncbi:MAG: hypothetical protein ACTSUE_07570 [Promethearchaeota archaeon]
MFSFRIANRLATKQEKRDFDRKGYAPSYDLNGRIDGTSTADEDHVRECLKKAQLSKGDYEAL